MSTQGVPPSVPTGLGPAEPHLAQSILVTLFCCMPAGVVAIVYSAMAMGKNSSHDYAGAHADAKTAATWGWVSFGIGLAVIALYGVFIILMAAAGAAGAAGP